MWRVNTPTNPKAFRILTASNNKTHNTMKKVDLWLDSPVDFYGAYSTCFPNVTHICTINEDDAYMESEEDNILYFNEMDEQMLQQVETFLTHNA